MGPSRNLTVQTPQKVLNRFHFLTYQQPLKVTPLDYPNMHRSLFKIQDINLYDTLQPFFKL